MPYCSKCGVEVSADAKFCEACGASLTAESKSVSFDSVKEKIENFNNTADTTNEYDSADINNNKIMAVIAYIGILFLVPLLAAKESKFARFHTNQAIVLLIAEIAVGFVLGVVSAILLAISPVLTILSSLLSAAVSIVSIVFTIIGIVNAATGKAKELPLIGSIKIIK